jgi:hypothetical protein
MGRDFFMRGEKAKQYGSDGKHICITILEGAFVSASPFFQRVEFETNHERPQKRSGLPRHQNTVSTLMTPPRLTKQTSASCRYDRSSRIRVCGCTKDGPLAVCSTPSSIFSTITQHSCRFGNGATIQRTVQIPHSAQRVEVHGPRYNLSSSSWALI